MWRAFYVVLLAFLFSTAVVTAQAKSFYAFESGPVRPIAMTPNKQRLLVTNIPDNRLEIYLIDSQGDLTHQESVPVGLEPVAVAARSDSEVWVVNHLSDSVSILDISRSPARVVNTLLVGDEPRDIVFAGVSKQRAFVTTAHRGQRRTDAALNSVPGAGDPQLTTEGVNRADVWVFDANATGTISGGKPEKIMTFFGDTPRALTVSQDKSTVYVGVFHSGNQTAVVHDGVVCDSSAGADPGECSNPNDNYTSPNGLANGKLPGGLFTPARNASGDFTPETGLIVKYNNQDKQWQDVPYTGAAKRNWSNGIRFTLPDYDVFKVNADSLDDTGAIKIPHVGTILYNMAVNPVSGKVFVSNTEANNHKRFEGPNYTISNGRGSQIERTVRGELHKSRITVIDPSNNSLKVRHLNKHINYAQVPSSAATKSASLATPMDMAVSADGRKLYVNAFGSSKVGVFETRQLENDADWATTNIQTQSQRYINVSGGGPAGMALDDQRKRLYVMTRFDNGISIIDTDAGREIKHITFYNPEPTKVTKGRNLLYDANKTSSNGEASCASCHVFGGLDSLAWDLGNPTGRNSKNSQCMGFEESIRECFRDPNSVQCGLDIFRNAGFRAGVNGNGKMRDFASMKGPMTTQTLKGMQNHGNMHWRGDRADGVFGKDLAGSKNSSNADGLENADNCFDDANPIDYDERLSFKNFVVAFEGLLGHSEQPSEAEMNDFADFALELMLPPNPIRNLDNSFTASQKKGRDFFFGTMDPARPNVVTHHADGAPPGTPDFMNEPVGFTCAGCHTVNPSQGFFGTDGDQGITGEVQMMKTPHLRNLYTKVGMFGLPDRPGFGKLDDNSHQGEQVRGFGFLHDGATDTLLHFMQGAVFVNPSPNSGFADGASGMQQRKEVEEYLLAFDSDLAPITGQQVTLKRGAAADVLSRLSLLQQRAQADFVSKELGGQVKECELIAKGVLNNQRVGYLYQPATNRYESDKAGETALSATDLQSRVTSNADNAMTFTCVPAGAGRRSALDRDSDNIKDRDDRKLGGSIAPPVATLPSQPSTPPATPPSSSSGGGGAFALPFIFLMLILRRRL